MSSNTSNGNGTKHWPSTILLAVLISIITGLVGNGLGLREGIARVELVKGDVARMQRELDVLKSERTRDASDQKELVAAVNGLRAEVATMSKEFYSLRAQNYMKGGG